MKKFYFLLSFSFICFGLLNLNSLSGQNLLQNPGFESGALEPWFADNGNVVDIVQDSSAEGQYAAVGNAAQSLDLVKDVNYELTCKAKILSASGTEKVWIGVRGPSALVQNSEIFSTTDWEDMSIDFTAPETGTYKIWIWGQGSSSYTSDDWILLVEGTFNTSLNDELAKDAIKVYNTFEGVTIDMAGKKLHQSANVSVMDITGKQVFSLSTEANELVLPNGQFPTSGVYLVSVQTGDLHRIEKVMIVGN